MTLQQAIDAGLRLETYDTTGAAEPIFTVDRDKLKMVLARNEDGAICGSWWLVPFPITNAVEVTP